MRIIKKDLKQGLLFVQPENPDDLWDLHSIIDVGDTVRASTERKINLGGSEEKSRVIKKKVTLSLSVEKTEFSDTLRILGKITEAPDDMPKGSSHSFTISVGDELSVTKKTWATYQLERIETATQKRSNMLVVLFDREHALFLSVGGRNVETLLTLKGEVNKKAVDENKKSSFYADIIKHTQDYAQRMELSGIVYASPAFWQEYAKKILPADLAKKVIFTTISDVEKTAVKELVKRPELEKILTNNRSAKEMGFVEEIMTGMAHEQVAYGDADVAHIIAEGNVKAVFLSEHRIQHEREQETFGKTQELLQQAEAAGGIVHILVSKEAAKQLDDLGGLVVRKRW